MISLRHRTARAVAPAAVAAAILATTPVADSRASAIDPSCNPGKPGAALSLDEAAAVYDCIAAALDAGWKAGPKRWIPADRTERYRGWALASKLPAAPGPHDGRFLLTRVNAIGHTAYTRYAEDPVIPVGTLIAKESFTVTDEGLVEAGPLFFMEKVSRGTSPDTLDWYYYAVAPDGRPMAVNVITACNSCHVDVYGYQGGLGYPVEEARLP